MDLSDIDWLGSDTAYEQIAEALRQRIVAGEFDRSGLLPKRQTLAAEYDVSVGTIAKATRLLQDAEIVRYEPGQGIALVG